MGCKALAESPPLRPNGSASSAAWPAVLAAADTSIHRRAAAGSARAGTATHAPIAAAANVPRWFSPRAALTRACLFPEPSRVRPHPPAPLPHLLPLHPPLLIPCINLASFLTTPPPPSPTSRYQPCPPFAPSSRLAASRPPRRPTESRALCRCHLHLPPHVVPATAILAAAAGALAVTLAAATAAAAASAARPPYQRFRSFPSPDPRAVAAKCR